MANAAKSVLHRIFVWLWRRPSFRRGFYHLLGVFFRRRTGWQMMNCGYRPDPSAPAVGDNGTEQFCYELYARLVDDTPLAGRDVLEIGSGRGGGARYLHHRFAPRRMLAMDYAPSTVRWCRRHFARPGLEYSHGDARNLRLPPESFDVIVAVEVTHCLADKPGFLAAAARVLRPGGRLLVADFFYRRADAMHALAKFEAAIAGSRFVIVALDDWTPGVMAAIEADSERRKAEIPAGLPAFAREIALQFISTTESPTYAAMRAGRTIYRRYVLQRR